jgi:hypothetical protein
MSEEKVKDAELKHEAKSEVTDAVTTVVSEAAKFLDTLGRAMCTVAQDLTNLMVIQVDADTRRQLDVVVNSGAVRSRREAAVALLHDGIEAQQATMERARQTQAQIQELRQQLRSLVQVRSA